METDTKLPMSKRKKHPIKPNPEPVLIESCREEEKKLAKKHKKGHPFRSAVGLYLLLYALSGVPSNLIAQDFSDLPSKKAFSLSGNIGAQVSSRLSDWNTVQDPFAYALQIQLNPAVYGFSLPFSFTLADNRFSFTQPFSQLSFSPSYKWIQLHLGRTSMNMHPYGLSGHQFDGIGIALTPDFPLQFWAMYGRLVKAREGDTALIAGMDEYANAANPAYKRTGYAFKISFNQKGQQISLHFLRADDHKNSLSPAYYQYTSPKANAVLAIDFSFSLYKDLKLNGQAGLSSYTGNILEEKENKNGILAGLMSPFLRQRPSTSLHTAYKIGVTFKGASLSYERVSPGYETMGAYYFNRDFENVVLSFARNFSKFSIKADIGWQRDDLAQDKASRMDRIVGSAYLNYQISEMFSLTASYSNFTAYTQVKPIDLTRPDEPWVQDPDTIAFRQISQQAQLSLSFNSPSETLRPQQAGIDISYQSSRDKSQETFNDYIYAALRHGIRFEGDYQLQSAINFSTGIDRDAFRPATFSYSIGPSIVLSKTLFKKALRLSGGLNYYWDMYGKQSNGSIAGLRLRASYTLAKVHVFDLQFNGRLRFDKAMPGIGKEMHIAAGYRYRFKLDPGEIRMKGMQWKKERKAKRNARLIRHIPTTLSW